MKEKINGIMFTSKLREFCVSKKGRLMNEILLNLREYECLIYPITNIMLDSLLWEHFLGTLHILGLITKNLSLRGANETHLYTCVVVSSINRFSGKFNIAIWDFERNCCE